MLALDIAEQRPSVYLDLKSPAARARQSNREQYFSDHGHELIVLDEVHRMPELFHILRSVIHRGGRSGKKSGRFLPNSPRTLSRGASIWRLSRRTMAHRIAARARTRRVDDEGENSDGQGYPSRFSETG